MTFRQLRRFSVLLFAGLTAAAGTTSGESAESYRLSPESGLGAATRVEYAMEAGGEMTLREASENASQKPQIKKMPMSVAATLVYEERQVSDGAKGPIWTRYYEQASATIKLAKGGQRPALADEHRLLAVHRSTGKPVIWAPGATLAREELDLVDSPANSVLLHELLPEQKVQVGSVWTHSDLLIASLLSIDVIDVNSAKTALLEVQDGQAKMSLTGAVQGSVGGVGTEIEIKAKYNFDLKLKRVVWFAMVVKEKRSIGHVGPGLDITAKLTIKVTPLETARHLTEEFAAKATSPPTAEELALHYESPNKLFRLEHDRRWFVTGEHDELTVMRMVDHGELVAQCNVSPTGIVDPAHPPTLDQFQRDIQQALGSHFDTFAKARESLDDDGRRVLRVVANGAVSEVPIEWVYYLITDQSGRQATVGFTCESDLIARFGAADQELVRGLSLTRAPVETARQPTPVESAK